MNTRLLDHLSPYQHVCHEWILPVADRLLGQHTRARVDELLDFQWRSRADIDAFRDRRLAQLLQYAGTTVPYYHEAFARDRIDLNAPLTADILSELPILTKTHLRERFDDLQVPDFRAKTYRMMSSGSTGAQTVVLLDKACQDEVFASQLMFWSWGGFAMGRPHLQTGMSLTRGTVKTLKDLVFRCSYASAFALTDEKLAAMVDTIRSRGIRHVFGYASSIYVLARYAREHAPELTLDAVFTWGDSLFPHYRELIEATFGCMVFDVYGLGEGLQCAAQCGQNAGLHVAEHGVIVEIVNGEGAPCSDGELGRVVVTRLEPGVMPLIRYDTGDVAQWLTDQHCDCGRNLKLISRIQGRSTDIVTTPSGDRLIVHYFTQIFEMIPEVAQFQVRQSEPGSIRILYIPGTGFHAGILDRIRREILENCQYPLEIDFAEVQEIPLQKSNKRRFVISDVPF